MSKAPVTAEQLFRTYFLPLYPEDAKADLAAARGNDANPGNNPGVLGHLDEAAEIFAAHAPSLFSSAPSQLALDFTEASVHRLSAALSPARRDVWMMADDAIAESAESAESRNLFNVVVHGAAYVGTCIVRAHGGAASWGVRRPLWESVVRLVSRAGEADLSVFHWWLKALSDDEGGHTLADRYRTHVEIPCARPEELPVIAPEDRVLPRITRPRYDVLYKYLKAHLPELKDLGKDFPSPERFEDFRFASVEMRLLGQGRMLLMHAQGEHGVSLLWLTASGFEKSAFYPADSFPAHRIDVDGDKLRLIASVAGKMVVHEMLWWGP
jgi:hypothetical protein